MKNSTDLEERTVRDKSKPLNSCLLYFVKENDTNKLQKLCFGKEGVGFL